jgi:hypothetical protein
MRTRTDVRRHSELVSHAQATCDGRPSGKGFVAGMALTFAGDALVLIG